MRVFLDTPVLVAAYDRSYPDRQEIALGLLSAQHDTQVVISAQVMTEFFTLVTWHLDEPLNADAGVTALGLLARLHVVPIDAELVIAGAQGDDVSFRDALVLAAAQRAGCTTLFSDGLAAGSYGDLEVVNPFASDEAI